MPRPPARHGTRSRYQTCTDGANGKQCDPCKLAEANYQKARRHGVKAPVVTLKTAAQEPVDQPDAPPEPGINETGVIAELDGVPAATNRPGLYAVAITLARLLDNPLAVAQHPSAAEKLNKILDQLRKGAEKKGRLTAVRQMSKPSSATG